MTHTAALHEVGPRHTLTIVSLSVWAHGALVRSNVIDTRLSFSGGAMADDVWAEALKRLLADRDEARRWLQEIDAALGELPRPNVTTSRRG